MGKKESIEDTARVLGRFYDGIEFRGFAQTDVEDLAENAGVPVWNGLTTEWHPTQMLADILTVQENFNYDIKGKTLVFMGDAANNVARSLMVVCSKLGMNFVACGPKENMPDAELVKTCEAIAAENGCTVKCTDDVKDACTGADVIYTDVWVSMGEPDEVWAERIKHLEKFRVTKEVMAMANPDAIFLHCLPAFHDTNTTIGAISPSASASPRWKWRTRCSSPRPPRSSTRPRTACTPSRPSCTPPSAANLPRTCFIGASESARPCWK